MDKISIVGLLLGFLAIVLGQVLEGGHVGSLVQPTAFFIVIGGTLGAVMLQSPLPTFLLGARMARWVIFPPRVVPAQLFFGQCVAQHCHQHQWQQLAQKVGRQHRHRPGTSKGTGKAKGRCGQ